MLTGKFAYKASLLTAVFFLFLACCRWASAEVTAVADVSQRLVSVGTLFQVMVTVATDSGQSIERPAWPQIDGLTLLNPNMGQSHSINIINRQSQAEYTWYAEYRADEEGTFEISPIRISVRNSSGIIEEITANPVSVEVFLDAPKPASDIRPSPAFPWQKLLITISLIAAIAGLLAYWYRIRNRALQAPPVPVAVTKTDTRTPEQLAISEIESLPLPDFYNILKIREYYHEVDRILREYLKQRYEVETAEATTLELRNALKSRNRADQRIEGVFGLLNDCNWVKYAKLEPSPSDIRDIHPRVREVLTGTRI